VEPDEIRLSDANNALRESRIFRYSLRPELHPDFVTRSQGLDPHDPEQLDRLISRIHTQLRSVEPSLEEDGPRFQRYLQSIAQAACEQSTPEHLQDAFYNLTALCLSQPTDAQALYEPRP
jgi:hypothetical protein